MIRNEIELVGKITIRAFKRGEIAYWIDKGLSLNEAVTKAVKRGSCVYENTVNNLVVTTGKQLMAELLTGDESGGLLYHEIGTGTTTPALTDTALTTPSARKAVTQAVRSGNDVNVSTFYLASESTIEIAEGGLFGGAAATATPGSGMMFCHYLQTYDNSAGTYDLTFEYTLTIN